MQRFYNLKLERPDVFGLVIILDSDAPLETRLSSPSSKEQITLTQYDRKTGSATYVLTIVDGHLIANQRKPDRYVGFRVHGNQATLTDHTPAEVPVYFEEISKEKAAKIQEGAEYWRALQAWI
jgi:hypothetical protein